MIAEAILATIPAADFPAGNPNFWQHRSQRFEKDSNVDWGGSTFQNLRNRSPHAFKNKPGFSRMFGVSLAGHPAVAFEFGFDGGNRPFHLGFQRSLPTEQAFFLPSRAPRGLHNFAVKNRVIAQQQRVTAMRGGEARLPEHPGIANHPRRHGNAHPQQHGPSRRLHALAFQAARPTNQNRENREHQKRGPA